MKKLILIAALMAGPASAENLRLLWMDGNELHELCSEASGQYGKGVCMGYVVGVLDGNNMHSDISASNSEGAYTICTALTAPRGQVRDVVKKYLTDNPGIRHYNAAIIVMEAITEAFPCE